MLIGTPKILLLNTKNFTLHPKIEKILNELKRARLIFFDPVSSAKHVNSISDNPSKWYNSNNIKITRMEHLKLTFGLNK